MLRLQAQIKGFFHTTSYQRISKRNISFYTPEAGVDEIEPHEYDNIKDWQERLIEVAPSNLSSSIKKTIHEAAVQSRVNLPNNLVGRYFGNLKKKASYINTVLLDWPEEITKNKFKGYNISHINPESLLRKPLHQFYRQCPSGVLFLSSEIPTDRITIPIYPQYKIFGEQISDNGSFNYLPCITPNEYVASYFIAKKVDGIPFQIGYDEEDYWIAGSSEQKLIFKSTQDLIHYKSNRKFAKEVEMVEFVFSELEKSPESLQDLKHFLFLTRLTLNFVYSSPNLLYPIPISEKSFALVSCSGPQMEFPTCPPSLTYAMSRYFDLPSVLEEGNHKFYPIATYSNQSIRTSWKSGAQIVQLLRADNTVSAQLKVKPYWYTYIDAIFKAISTHLFFPSDLELTKLELEFKLFDIYRGSSSESHPYQVFHIIGAEFIDWIVKNHPPRALFTHSQLSSLWDKFLIEKNYPLDEKILELNFETPIKYIHNEEYRSSLPLLVVFQGPIGIGKKHLSNLAVNSLENELNLKAIHINDDEFASSPDPDRALLLHVAKTIKSKENKVVIVSTHTTNQHLTNQFARLSKIHHCKILFLGAKERLTGQIGFILYSVCSLIKSKQQNQINGEINSFKDQISYNSLISIPFRDWRKMEEHTQALGVNICSPSLSIDREKEENQVDTNDDENISRVTEEEINDDKVTENKEVLQVEEAPPIINRSDQEYMSNEWVPGMMRRGKLLEESEEESHDLAMLRVIVSRFGNPKLSINDRLFDREIEDLNLSDPDYVQSIVNYKRPDDETVKDICHYIQHFLTLPYTPVSSRFICSPDITAISNIFARICYLGGNIPPKWQYSCNVIVTNSWDNNLQAWSRLSQLCGAQLNITPIDLLITKHFWVLYVSLEVAATGESLDNLFPNEKPMILVAASPDYRTLDESQIESSTLYKGYVECGDRIPTFQGTLQEADYNYWPFSDRNRIRSFLSDQYPPLSSNETDQQQQQEKKEGEV